MGQCIEQLAQMIQQGAIDPAMPVGALVEQMMQGGGQPQQAPQPQGLGQVMPG